METILKQARELRKGDVVVANGAEFVATQDPTEPDDNGLVVVWLDGFLHNNHGVYIVQWFEFTVKVEAPEDKFRRCLSAQSLHNTRADRAVQAARDAGLL